ncbi:hypothetical protein [Streptomyces huasconensis]|uniref:hypothetical protein n=1 Tax=Streptomyces huasconensis TaxID=1854574 RepID=UPI0036F75BEB
MDALTSAEQERAGRLAVADQSVLAAFRVHPIVNRYLTVDIRKGYAWFAFLNEQLHRYPLDDRQGGLSGPAPGHEGRSW